MCPDPRRLRPHCSCPAREEPRVCTAASSFRAEWLQPVPRPTDCRTLDDVLRATEGAYQRITESRGAPAVPHCETTLGSRRTGCSNSHRFSSPAFPRLGCSLPLCHVSLLSREPKFLLATEGAYQRITESRGAPAVPHHFGRVGSRRTGCSNSHRFSSPAFPRFGCSLLLCVSFHC